MLSQQQIHNLQFDTVTEAETKGRKREICFIQQTQTFYQFVENGEVFPIDHIKVLATGDGDNTRWCAISGRYTTLSQYFTVNVVADENVPEGLEGGLYYRRVDKGLYLGTE